MGDVELILAQETIDRQADEITRLRERREYHESRHYFWEAKAVALTARAEAAEAEQDRLTELNAALRFGRDQSQDQATAFYNRAEAAEAERDRLREYAKWVSDRYNVPSFEALKEQSDE
jgi:hypothetical protein